MGHAFLEALDSGANLWTGDSFEYLYVRDGDREHHLPSKVLYSELGIELRRAVISEIEQGSHSWQALASVLWTLRADAMLKARKTENDAQPH